MDEVSGAGQERQVGWNLGWGGGGLWVFGRAFGGAEGPERLAVPTLIEVVFRNGLGHSRIELRSLIEVVGEAFRGGLFCNP